MKHILTPGQAVEFLIIYGILMIGITLVVGFLQKKRGQKENLPEFLLASRGVRIIPGAMSIAASWIWAPALFVSSQKAFEQGLPGAFWFIFPNLLALVVFAPFALRVRKLFPQGFTLPQLIRDRYGSRVHGLYMVQFVGLQLCSFAVQILAGATLIEKLSGLPFSLVGLLLITIVLVYAILGGLRASVVTDYVHIVTIYLVCAITIPWAVYNAGGLSSVAAGFGGLSGKLTNIFDPWIFYSFGISTTIGLISGPIGDQMHWQRAYALKADKDVVKTFSMAAILFVVVPLSLSTLGFVAAGKVQLEGWTIETPQMVGPITVSLLLPAGVLIAFIVMLLSGLCSTLDSILCAMSSLSVVDLLQRRDRFKRVSVRPATSADDELIAQQLAPQPVGPEDLAKAALARDEYLGTETKLASIPENVPDQSYNDRNLLFARLAMIVTALIGYGIASIPGLKILHLFLFYGTLRASTLVPTIATILRPDLRANNVFFAVLLSLIFGAPVLAAGEFLGNPHLRVAGSLLVVGIGCAFCVRIKSVVSKSHS